jgi:hypothetical protein
MCVIKRIGAYVLLSLAVLATSWSLLHPEFFRIHDYTQAARVSEMARALEDGHFPVRWSPNFGFGYGMPLFEFYAPLPYYVGAGLFLIGLDIVLVLKSLWLVCSVLTLIGAYKLGSLLYGRSGGVITAVALTMAPYRAINLYIRGALAEAWGIMAMPWILLGIVLVVRNQKKGWLTLVLGLVSLFLSHNLTTLIFVPLSLVFAIGVIVIEKQKHSVSLRQISTLLGSYVLAIGLTTFYMVPAFIEKGYTKVSGIVGGYFDYSLHFLYVRQFVNPRWGFGGSNWGPDDGLSFFLGWGQLLGLVVMGGAVGWWMWRHLRTRRQLGRMVQSYQWQLVGLMALLVGVSVLMTLEKSKLIWDQVFLLPYIQFPWRWLGGAIVFLSVLIGSVVTFIPVKHFRYGWAALLSVILIVCNWGYFQPELYLSDANALYYTDETRIQEHMSKVLNDYIPSQMPFEPKPPTNLLFSTAHQANPIEVLVDRGHEKLIRTDFSQSALVEIAIGDFPGWQVEVDGQPVAKTTSSRGLISLTVPQGQHLVGVYFGSTPVRQVSDMISGLSLLIFLYLVIDLKTRHNLKS